MRGPVLVEERDLASDEDIRRILGDLDRAKVLDILSLRPTVLDLEQASMWISGDSDIFGPDEPLQALDIDSMDFLNFVIAVHRRLAVDIPELDYPKLITFDGAMAYLKAKLGLVKAWWRP